MALVRLHRYLLSVTVLSTFILVIGVVQLTFSNGGRSLTAEPTLSAEDNLFALDDVIKTLKNVTYPPPVNIDGHAKYGSNVTQVVLVTYQRTGSSFLGELFNQNPQAFVWFEPLDGVYSALYGTGYGYNVPADIWNYPDGTERTLPNVEKELLANTSAAILKCDFASLPTEVLLHNFVLMFLAQHKKLSAYAKCVEDGPDGLTKCQQCNKQLASICTQKFNGNSDGSKMCANELVTQYLPEQTPFPEVTASSQVKSAVAKYKECMKPCRARATKCIEHLRIPCLNSTLRSIKPVRLNMDTARLVRKHVPNLKYLHNLRDPRGVVHSRKHTSESFQSTYALIVKAKESRIKDKTGTIIKRNQGVTDIDPTKEAKLFCRNAGKDVHIRKLLEQEMQNSTLQVVYEHYAAHPHLAAEEIYEFLGSPLQEEVTNWLTKNTAGSQVQTAKQTSRHANQTLAKWQSEFTVKVMKEIDLECTQLYEEVNHVWPYS